jgi:hypothetical protein
VSQKSVVVFVEIFKGLAHGVFTKNFLFKKIKVGEKHKFFEINKSILYKDTNFCLFLYRKTSYFRHLDIGWILKFVLLIGVSKYPLN